jgi:hypothetical protein
MIDWAELRVVLFKASVALLWMAGASPAAATSYHDNIVQMPLAATGYINITATYTITAFSVTPGQDPDGRIHVGLANTYTGNAGSMTYHVGRKGSTTVADWWRTRIASDHNTFGNDPRDLNFAFIGTLVMKLTGGPLGHSQDTYTLQNIALAQGHAGASNNWWFGGSNCKYATSFPNSVKCSGTNSAGRTVYFYFHRGGADHPVNIVDLFSIQYAP